MSNLLELAKQATVNNVTKGRSNRKSINDSLFDMLHGKDPMPKLDIVTNISLERLKNESDEEITAKNFGSDEIQKEFKRITRTVSNGFDTAVCQGKTSASFCSNKKYMEKYEVIKNQDDTYSIEDKK